MGESKRLRLFIGLRRYSQNLDPASLSVLFRDIPPQDITSKLGFFLLDSSDFPLDLEHELLEKMLTAINNDDMAVFRSVVEPVMVGRINELIGKFGFECIAEELLQAFFIVYHLQFPRNFLRLKDKSALKLKFVDHLWTFVLEQVTLLISDNDGVIFSTLSEVSKRFSTLCRSNENLFYRAFRTWLASYSAKCVNWTSFWTLYKKLSDTSFLDFYQINETIVLKDLTDVQSILEIVELTGSLADIVSRVVQHDPDKIHLCLDGSPVAGLRQAIPTVNRTADEFFEKFLGLKETAGRVIIKEVNTVLNFLMYLKKHSHLEILFNVDTLAINPGSTHNLPSNHQSTHKLSSKHSTHLMSISEENIDVIENEALTQSQNIVLHQEEIPKGQPIQEPLKTSAFKQAPSGILDTNTKTNPATDKKTPAVSVQTSVVGSTIQNQSQVLRTGIGKKLLEIFQFYCTKYLVLGKKLFSFDRVSFQKNHLRVNGFCQFCIDFGIKNKSQNLPTLVKIYKSFAQGNEAIDFATFQILMVHLAKIMYPHEKDDFKSTMLKFYTRLGLLDSSFLDKMKDNQFHFESFGLRSVSKPKNKLKRSITNGNLANFQNIDISNFMHESSGKRSDGGQQVVWRMGTSIASKTGCRLNSKRAFKNIRADKKSPRQFKGKIEPGAVEVGQRIKGENQVSGKKSRDQENSAAVE
jgi:hypothetical protein